MSTSVIMKDEEKSVRISNEEEDEYEEDDKDVVIEEESTDDEIELWLSSLKTTKLQISERKSPEKISSEEGRTFRPRVPETRLPFFFV